MAKYTLHNVISGDFKLMHKLLNDIEINISGVEPFTQTEFIQPLKNIIYEAWRDTCDHNDSFLFKPNSDKNPEQSVATDDDSSNSPDNQNPLPTEGKGD